MIKKIFHLLMALLVLVATSGMTINRMECFKTGKIKASIFEIKNCCPEDNSASNTIQSKCCDYTVSYHKVQTNTTLEKEKFIQKFVLKFSAHFLIQFISLTSVKDKASDFRTSLPPIIAGKNLLQVIQVFRI